MIVETAALPGQQTYVSPTAKSLPSGAKLPRGSELVFPLGNTRPFQDQEVEPGARTAATASQQPSISFTTLESWVCKVEAVDKAGGAFSAIAVSDRQAGLEEMAEFSFDELSEDDVELVEPGAVFYWSVGYQISPFGGRATASVLRFRRLRHWTRKELEAARARAAAYDSWIAAPQINAGPSSAS